MRRLLRIVFVVCLFAGAAPPCLAGTPPSPHDVFIYMPSPRYPPEAWERRSNGWRPIGGLTVCRLYLDARGAVIGVHVIKSSGNKMLDAASTGALRNWRAKPGPLGRFFDVPIIFEQGSAKSTGSDGLGFSKSSDVGK